MITNKNTSEDCPWYSMTYCDAGTETIFSAVAEGKRSLYMIHSCPVPLAKAHVHPQFAQFAQCLIHITSSVSD